MSHTSSLGHHDHPLGPITFAGSTVNIAAEELSRLPSRIQDWVLNIYYSHLRLEAENKWLREESRMDYLTRAPNMRAYEEKMTKIIRFFRNFESGNYTHREGDNKKLDDTTILFLDLDKFKLINDNFGHAGGDAALKTVARTIQDSIREDDYFARIGGDEFIVILRHANQEIAQTVLQKIQDNVEEAQCPFNYKDQYDQTTKVANIPISISGGCAQLTINDVLPNEKTVESILVDIKTRAELDKDTNKAKIINGETKDVRYIRRLEAVLGYAPRMSREEMPLPTREALLDALSSDIPPINPYPPQ